MNHDSSAKLTVAGICLVCLSLANAESVGKISVDQSVTFSSADGDSVTVAAGEYDIESVTEDTGLLVAADG